MDYNTFCLQNGFIQYQFENGESVPMIPLRTTCPEYTSLSAQCNELIPCNKSTNKIMRYGPWIKDKWLKLQSYISLVLSDGKKLKLSFHLLHIFLH
jgi:hypothetical protein